MELAETATLARDTLPHSDTRAVTNTAAVDRVLVIVGRGVRRGMERVFKLRDDVMIVGTESGFA